MVARKYRLNGENLLGFYLSLQELLFLGGIGKIACDKTYIIDEIPIVNDVQIM